MTDAYNINIFFWLSLSFQGERVFLPLLLFFRSFLFLFFFGDSVFVLVGFKSSCGAV